MAVLMLEKSYRERAGLIFVVLLGLCLPAGLMAQTTDDPAAALIREEQARTLFADILDRGTHPREKDLAKDREFVLAAHELAAGGSDMLPLLFDEVDRTVQQTFFLCTYALGLMGGEEARQILMQALERANADLDDYGIARKAWTSYSLALMGEHQALQWINAPPRPAGHIPLHQLTSTIEGIAFLVGKTGTPILIAEYKRLREDPEYELQWQFLIMSLGRTDNDEALPLLHSILTDDDRKKNRREAGRALANLARPASVPTLMASLKNEPNEYVRRASARALFEIFPTDHIEGLLERFENEGSPGVRSYLLKMLIPMKGAAAIPLIRNNWYRMRSVDRAEALKRLAVLGEDALPIIGRGLQSTDKRVITSAIQALGEIGTPQARLQLEDFVRSPSWNMAYLAAAELAYRGFTENADLVAERLLTQELSKPIRDPQVRDRVYLTMNLLIGLNYSQRQDEFRLAQETQPDPQLTAFMELRIHEMGLLASNGDSNKKWLKLLGGETTTTIRNLAYRRLTEIGGNSKIAQGLIATFDDADQSTRIWIVSTLASFPGDDTKALLTRILSAETFRSYHHEELRDAAAYTARILGGPSMTDLLGQSVRISGGRDTRVLVYWAILAGKEAVDGIREFRLTRFRFANSRRGLEQIKLDRLVRELRAGRSLAEYDLPPGELKL